MDRSSPGAEDASEPRQRRPLRYQVAFFLTALVTLALVVTLPFSVKSVVDDVLGAATGQVFQITRPGSERTGQALPDRLRNREASYTRLHLAVIAIDEVRLLATIRMSGHHRCSGCAFSHRVRVVAIGEDDASAYGLPPSGAITLGATDMVVSETVQLPLQGHPIHYPFDQYRIVLAVAYQRLYADGRREAIGPDQGDDQLFLSFQELLPRSVMVGPVTVRSAPRAGQ